MNDLITQLILFINPTSICSLLKQKLCWWFIQFCVINPSYICQKLYFCILHSSNCGEVQLIELQAFAQSDVLSLSWIEYSSRFD